jgi:hypothetical protein
MHILLPGKKSRIEGEKKLKTITMDAYYGEMTRSSRQGWCTIDIASCSWKQDVSCTYTEGWAKCILSLREEKFRKLASCILYVEGWGVCKDSVSERRISVQYARYLCLIGRREKPPTYILRLGILSVC